jgi:hypothetical protein
VHRYFVSPCCLYENQSLAPGAIHTTTAIFFKRIRHHPVFKIWPRRPIISLVAGSIFLVSFLQTRLPSTFSFAKLRYLGNFPFEGNASSKLLARATSRAASHHVRVLKAALFLSLLSHFPTPADAFSIVVADRSNASRNSLSAFFRPNLCVPLRTAACNFELDSHPGRRLSS